MFTKVLNQIRSFRLPRPITIALKILIGILALVFIVPHYLEFSDRLSDSQLSFSCHSKAMIASAILLSSANWSIETIKWHLLICRNHKISFTRSVSAVLQGIVFSIVTPNRIGEIIGRSMAINENKSAAVYASIIGSLSQLLSTIVFGSISLMVFFGRKGNTVFASACGLIAIGCLIAYCFIPKLTSMFPKLTPLQKLNNVNFKTLITAAALSSLRYIIFSTQFALLIFAFGIKAHALDVYFASFATFLFTTVVPSNILSEIGIRGGASLYCFSFITDVPFIATLASWALWLINLATPAIIGITAIILKKVLTELRTSS